jgi:hypothetical protein
MARSRGRAAHRRRIASPSERSGITEISSSLASNCRVRGCRVKAALRAPGAEERGFHYVVPQEPVSGMLSSEQVANRPVRDYVRSMHPSVDYAEALLRE